MQSRYLSFGAYPQPIRELKKPPRALNVIGDITPARFHVAIVGSRLASGVTIALVERLAAIVVRAGGVVISGGADGADAAAHVGAIEAGGRTWSVLGCGSPNFTETDDPLRFDRIVESGGAIIRPFVEGTKASSACFKSRNRVLVALSHLVIIAQAGFPSGTFSAAYHAKKLGREMWVAPGVGKAFVGSWMMIDRGARMLRSESELEQRLANPTFDGDVHRVFKALESRAKHPDEIALETGLTTPAVTTALLTLALGDVVVEGSAGLFQRK